MNWRPTDLRDIMPSDDNCSSFSEWQDISTAPKDGTEIILYSPPQTYAGELVSARVTAGAWTELPEGEDGEPGACWGSWDGGFTDENPPTHWMPLPEPPADLPVGRVKNAG